MSNRLPNLGYPISDSIITCDDKLLLTMKIKGSSFETKSENDLNASFDTIKQLLFSLSEYSNQLSLWTHIIKKKDELEFDSSRYETEFSQKFMQKYVSYISKENLYKISYYITFCYKYVGDVNDGIDELQDLSEQFESALSDFNPHILRISNDGSRTRNIEFLNYLFNYQDEKLPLFDETVKSVIGRSEHHFGHDVSEVRNADSNTSKYATYYQCDLLSPMTMPRDFDFILNHKGEFILTQSLVLLNTNKTKSAIKNIGTQISDAKNMEFELEEIELAKSLAQSNVALFGDYHFSLVTFGNTPEQALDCGNNLRGKFIAKGYMLKRSNLNSVHQFLAQIPNCKNRMLSSVRVTENLACLFSLSNFPSGKKEGNPLGDGSYIMPFKTKADTLFYFNSQVTELSENSIGKAYVGHSIFTGPSGSGKTTLLNAKIQSISRFKPKIFAIDYQASLSFNLLSLGGYYDHLEYGKPTNINPFKFPDSKELREYLIKMICSLVDDLNEEKKQEIAQGIETVFNTYEQRDRTFARFLETVSDSVIDDVKRFSREHNGDLAWVFDSEKHLDLSSESIVGFDITKILDSHDDKIITVITSYLFYLKRLIQTGSNLSITIIDEYWSCVNNPLIYPHIAQILKAGRTRNEFLYLSSQSIEHAIDSPIRSEILDNTKTKVFFYKKGEQVTESYTNKMKLGGLNDIEIEKLCSENLPVNSFLIKQNESIFVNFNLKGFDQELKILSPKFKDFLDYTQSTNKDEYIKKLIGV